jgi:hypothetical protein
MCTIEQTLGLWASGLLSPEAVMEWAGREIARLDQPPMELFDLVSYGPEKCLKKAKIDFPYAPAIPTYFQAFAVRAMRINVESDDDVWSFASWASRNCMGQSLSDPLVALGYQLDHYIDDCQDRDGAIALVREVLPSILSQCKLLALPYADCDAHRFRQANLP